MFTVYAVTSNNYDKPHCTVLYGNTTNPLKCMSDSKKL